MAFIFIITNVFICNAQDVKPDKIFKKDGTKIESKVLEITPSEIKYKKFSNLDGPTYSILKTEIILIEYASGEVEKMNEVSSPTATPSSNSNPEKIVNRQSKLQAYYGKSISNISVDLGYNHLEFNIFRIHQRYRIGLTFAYLRVFKKAVAMGAGFGAGICLGELNGYDFPLFYNIRFFPSKRFFIDFKTGFSIWISDNEREIITYSTAIGSNRQIESYEVVVERFVYPAHFYSINIGYNFSRKFGTGTYCSVFQAYLESIYQLTAGISVFYKF